MRTQREGSHLSAEERGVEQILPIQPSEGTSSADNMIQNLQPPQVGENKFVLLKLVPHRGTFYGSLHKFNALNSNTGLRDDSKSS